MPTLPSLLLIEDQMLLSNLLGTHLADKFLVDIALTPEQAREQIAAKKFDIVLLDLKLDNSGELAGLTLLPSLNENGAPVIVVSAYCTGGAKVVCLHNGIRGFVDKMYCPDGLMPTIETVLAGQQRFPPEWAAISCADLPVLSNSAFKLLKVLVKCPKCTNELLAVKVRRSLSTVKKNISILLRAFNCDTRYELINKVSRDGYMAALESISRRGLRM